MIYDGALSWGSLLGHAVKLLGTSPMYMKKIGKEPLNSLVGGVANLLLCISLHMLSSTLPYIDCES